MAKEKDDSGEFWRGYVWGIFTPPLVGAGLTVLTVAGAMIVGLTSKRQPAEVLRGWRGQETVPPPIDVEAR